MAMSSRKLPTQAIIGETWKFDLTNIDDTKWHVLFGGQPLFTAKGGTKGSPDSRTLVQPITVAPTARVNDRQKKVGSGTNEVMVSVGGMMVSFGTGRNLTKLDETNQNVQTDCLSAPETTLAIWKKDSPW